MTAPPPPPPTITITEPICALCHQFINELFALNFTRSQNSHYHSSCPPGWEPGSFDYPGWGDGFHHRETLTDLAESAKTCAVCNVFHADFAPLGLDNMCEGWFGLYPFWTQGKYGGNGRKGHFRAGFRDSLTKMPRGSNIILSDPLYSFRICLREHVPSDEKAGPVDKYRRFHAVPASLDLPSISRVVERWQRECSESHACCLKEDAPANELPTRVIDVGTGDEMASQLRLYGSSKGEKAPYIALSHCWGGLIPSVTTEANKTTRTSTLDINDLPPNFRDAIQVTRALGIRYLWIDSLCIIQDSKADWLREAQKMASIYAGATVVISALDSPSSTAGFLNQSRAPVAPLNDQYAVQKVYPQVYSYLHACPLVRRGWCMQERLLSPAILHFGREQLFWECRAGFRCEDELEFSGRAEHDITAKFIAIRSRISVTAARGNTPLEWRDWYSLLEEYTSRALTVPADKLPALAGAAALFKSTRTGAADANTGATYVAGLWKEDLKPGLLWAAHYDHIPGQKALGPGGKISKLSKPRNQKGEEGEERAPSWSWASIDGQVDFWALRLGTGDGFQVVDVAMEVGEDELAEAHPRGTLKIKGLVARMFYRPHPDGHSTGVLTFGRSDDTKDRSGTLSGCLVDIDRITERFCWAAIAARSSGSWLLLVLEECGDGDGHRDGASRYKRIGMCISHSVNMDPERFEMREILVS